MFTVNSKNCDLFDFKFLNSSILTTHDLTLKVPYRVHKNVILNQFAITTKHNFKSLTLD